jgi:RNA polymerase sigma-70 factor (ECF subfamily)
VVLSAADDHSPEARDALEKLCRTYWRPLYTYVRHRGLTSDDAQDLTQEFFWRLLDWNYLSQVDPRKGKFRSFLLVAVNHFLANEWDKARAVKRGGRITFPPLDAEGAEEHLQAVPASHSTSPEKLYEQSWSLALLEKAFGRLRQEARDAGRERQFAELKTLLTACEMYVLQHTPQLNPPNWQDVSSGTLSNGNWYQAINLTVGSGYYRLRLKP